MALTPESWPRPLRRAIRTSNKYLLNPVMRRSAGRKDAYAGMISHTGRKSGKRYSTPVGFEPVAGGFVIPLGYGVHVDWLRNVLAAGRATATVDGDTVEVIDPVVIDAAAAVPMLAPTRRRRYERLGIKQYLSVTRA